MGATSSTEAAISKEQREVETLASSTGALPLLHKSFILLADPASNLIPFSSLQQCFSIEYKNVSCEGANIPDCFYELLHHVPAAITDSFFVTEKGGISWVEFLRGYVRCCGRMSSSSLLNTLFKMLALSADKACCPLKLHFDSDEIDCKMSGSVSPSELGMILWVCWVMSWSARSRKEPKEQEDLSLPNVKPLVSSAVLSCADEGSDLDVWDCDVLLLEAELTAGKIHMWALRAVPYLTDCFSQFVHSRLQKVAASEMKGKGPSSSSSMDQSSSVACQSHLLKSGAAWAISLSQRSNIGEEILRICYPCSADVIDQSLLYRSSAHGKGLNRFWSSVEGYHAPVLILISACSTDASDSSGSSRKWIIGALIQQGFENRDVFYGSGGSLYAICPVFHLFSPSGKEKNFLYSHLHPTVRTYEPHPKPVGIAFGGTSGSERIFMDEDFAKVTIRHHAVDKTYQPGSLFPNQGFLPVEASVIEVEVWGLGGSTAKGVQNSYKKREELFTEQRRKVDLKTFASWEDSPEKMMMDMVGDPNQVRREDR